MADGKDILIMTPGWDPVDWREGLVAGAPERRVLTEPDRPDDPAIGYAVAWNPPHGALGALPNLKVIFSIGAGVDSILGDPDLPDVPIVRVVADDLTNRMSEYVVWRVMDHFRQGAGYRENQQKRQWRLIDQPAACDIRVGMMGLGVLGQDAAHKLRMLDFNLSGWSRSPKQVDGVTCHHGTEGLDAFLAESDILVVLLPDTPQTRGIIDYSLLSKMKQVTPLGGPILINAGRGALQVEADILRALDEDRLMAASLDVFEDEPLPESSPLWDRAAVTITPHAAAISDPRRLTPQMARQIRDFEAGKPLTNLVDRNRGY